MPFLQPTSIFSTFRIEPKKAIQKWDGYFDTVQLNKTTQAELSHWFVTLREVSNRTYVYDYYYFSPHVHLSDELSSANPHEGVGPRLSYVEYKFTINDSTKLVESKQKGFFDTDSIEDTGDCAKPVIYFYPTKEQDVSVHLQYAGEITASYPRYDPVLKGWTIRAYPDGRIINKSDQEEYSYLFWEGSSSPVAYDWSEGFVVEGENSEVFLRQTLKKMGLTPREYNEFIVYWFPKLKENKYNLIHFAHKEYEDLARLEITPTPDSLLRVFMVYKPLTEKIDIKPQNIKPFVRSGFTVVEWGGTELTTP